MLSSDAYDAFCDRIHDERRDEPEPPYPPCCSGRAIRLLEVVCP